MLRSALILAVLVAVAVAPILLAAQSPLLQWRQPVYIAAGLAGIIGLALMLFQPLLAAGVMPGIGLYAGRRVHRWIGAALVAMVVVHVVGLWFTSPPDVIDALTFTSPTLFTPFGVVAMWGVFGAAALAVFRRHLRVRIWRLGHSGLVTVTVMGTIAHAILIEGSMEPLSKYLLCGAVGLATLIALTVQKPWTSGRTGRRVQAPDDDP